MKFLLLPLTFLCSFTLHAQYFYNDIVGTQETNRQMQTYLANKVKTVTAVGYTANGTRATDFDELHELLESGKALKIVTMANSTRTASYNRFDGQGRVISISDTLLGVANITTYEYDNTGKIVVVQNTVKDPENEIDQVEVHTWFYNKNGKAERMWCVVNKKDSLEIRYTPDEDGNPGEEIVYRKGKETDRIYYYFDEQGHLTDIVRFDERVRKLMPENVITYDDGGRVLQVVSKSKGQEFKKITFVGYQTWRYVYNEKGLKVAEALFNYNMDMTGRIKFNYTFGQ